MIKTAVSLGLVAVVLFVAAGTVFGQGLTPKKIWNFTVAVNAPGANIYVDDVLIRGNTVKVAGGLHNVRVHADGFQDFSAQVTVRDHMTYQVRLSPLGFPLTVRVAVPNASVFVDGVDVSGSVPNVEPGSHTLLVTAPGYQDYNTTVMVNGPMALDVSLRPAGFVLSINANVPGAAVTVNNVAKGGVPYSELLPPGTYSVRVSANGYQDYIGNVTLDHAVPLNVQLQPALLPSTLSFVISPAFRDPDSRGNDPQSQVRIFIDNKLANPGRDLDRIPVTPGRHVVRVASGAFSQQLGELNVQPGMSYIIEISMAMNVRQVPSTR
jgi:hypothetical protein